MSEEDVQPSIDIISISLSINLKFQFENVEKAETFGLFLLVQNQNSQAEKLFKLILENYPDSLEALSGLASIYLKFEQIEKAERFCNEVLKLYPNDPPIHETLMHIYAITDRMDKAIESQEIWNGVKVKEEKRIDKIYERKKVRTE